jgi:protein involved in polysaccharide export with SLBB domain
MKTLLRIAILLLIAAHPCMANAPWHFAAPQPEPRFGDELDPIDPPAPVEKPGHFDAHAPLQFASLSVPQGPAGGLLDEPHDPYLLGPGDKLELELMEVPDTRQISIVMPDGDLYYQTAHVHAAGLTITQLKAALEQALDADYRDPQLSLILREMNSQRVMVMGRVNNPGIIPLDAPMTLVEAISRAGGLMIQRSGINSEELADLGHSFLVRDGQMMPINFVKLLRDGDASQNIYLKNGDFIYLPSSNSGRVYVLGAVNLARSVDYSEELTLVTAISYAQGLAPRSYPQRVVIIRNTLSHPEVATVNLKAMLNGKETDVRLQAGDIVWVPNSPFEKVESIVGGIFNSFARTEAANEGDRAVIRSPAPVVPSIGLGTGQ